MIVADCTLLAHLFIQNEHTGAAEAVLRRDPAWTVPPLWRSEMRSVLHKYLLAGLVELPAAVAVMDEAESVLAGGEREVPSADVLALVASTRCSAYDAEYVALATTLGVALVTSDRAMLERFADIAVSPERFASP